MKRRFNAPRSGDQLNRIAFPMGGKPSLPFIYSDGVWTGIEHQAAAHPDHDRAGRRGPRGCARRLELNKRISRHREFFGRREPGDLLVHSSTWRGPSLEGWLNKVLHERGPASMLTTVGAESAVQEYVAQVRAAGDSFYAPEDDSVPCAIVYWGIGGITAAMIGGEPVFDGSTSWLEPNLSWPDIDKLAFDPENKWVRMAVDVNRALQQRWEEDFMVLPYLHRSPLDAANGIRGTELFVEMYEEPDRVKALINWCADWSIALERLIAREAPRPAGCGVGVWGTWLPDNAVFVNGDPVGLLSREQGETFDRPSIEKLFTSTGGGFFHNHTIGLRQADLVSSYKGTVVQWFVNDPKQPSLAEALINMPELREKILAASIQCPIGGNVGCDQLDAFLDIARHGRFIVAVECTNDEDPRPYIKKVRKASKW